MVECKSLDFLISHLRHLWFVNSYSNYVDGAAAARDNLTYASNGHFILRADSTKRLNPNGPGRDSVRLRSFKQYTTFVMMYVQLIDIHIHTDQQRDHVDLIFTICLRVAGMSVLIITLETYFSYHNVGRGRPCGR